MNLHAVLNAALEEAKAAAVARAGKVDPTARIAEYRFEFVSTFLRALGRDDLVIAKRPKDPALDAADIRERLRAELVEKLGALPVHYDPEGDGLTEYVRRDDVEQLIG